jgi:hypothetical protein
MKGCAVLLGMITPFGEIGDCVKIIWLEKLYKSFLSGYQRQEMEI